MSALLEEPTNDKRIAITFDDGYHNNAQYAFPLLNQFGFTATVFVVTNQIGGYNAWDADNGDVREELLSLEELKSATLNGIEIGSHSLNHANLLDCSPEETWKEISESREILKEKLGQAPRIFCYPYGRQNEETRELVKKAGYQLACSTRKGSIQDDPFQLKRINVRRDSILPLFIMKLYRGLMYDR